MSKPENISQDAWEAALQWQEWYYASMEREVRETVARAIMDERFSRWRDISTAPKDGTEFDVWAVNDEGQSRRICEVSWGPVCDWAGNEWDDWRGMRPALYHAKFEPTHWMPLPNSPAAS